MAKHDFNPELNDEPQGAGGIIFVVQGMRLEDTAKKLEIDSNTMDRLLKLAAEHGREAIYADNQGGICTRSTLGELLERLALRMTMSEWKLRNLH